MHIRATASRRRLTPFAIAAGLIGSAVLGLGTTGTFSALTATITNTNNTAGTGTIKMQETDSAGTQAGSCASTDGGGTSTNSSTCTAFNKYGGSTTLLPGSGTSTKTVRIYNIGSMAASAFTIKPLTCSVPAANNPENTSGNICDYLKVTLSCVVTTSGSAGGSVSVYSGATLTSIAGTAVDLKTAKACTPAPTTAGGTSYTTFSFSVALDNTAGNTVQGQTATQNIEWNFQA